MATILDFRQVGAQQRSREPSVLADGAQPMSAELIFFPGVRYERVVDDPVEEPRRAVRKRTARGLVHDQIELPD